LANETGKEIKNTAEAQEERIADLQMALHEKDQDLINANKKIKELERYF